jgi:hypothetical protein
MVVRRQARKTQTVLDSVTRIAMAAGRKLLRELQVAVTAGEGLTGCPPHKHQAPVLRTERSEPWESVM